MTDNTEEIKREEYDDTHDDTIEESIEEEMKEEAPEAESEETEEKEEQEENKSEEKGEQEAVDEDMERKYLRLMADFQNYKKRVEKEKKDLYSYANEKIMGDLLEVMDNFERALEQNGAAAADDGGAGFKEGMEMIFKQLTDVLKKEGLEEITALGEDFDPNLHNAVMTEETEEYESGKVSGVMQKGYTLKGKVIRPSMVKVVN